MNSTQEYKIQFGRIARTLLYEDSQGAIRFTFDCSLGRGPNGKYIVELDHPSLVLKRINSIEDEHLRMAERQRMDLAIERTKQYLLSCGYEIGT